MILTSGTLDPVIYSLLVSAFDERRKVAVLVSLVVNMWAYMVEKYVLRVYRFKILGFYITAFGDLFSKGKVNE